MATDLDEGDYSKIELSKGKKEITLFVNPDKECEPTTADATGEHSNVLLAKLYLDRLGTTNQILRLLGLLSMLYVKNFRTLSETASLSSTSP